MWHHFDVSFQESYRNCLKLTLTDFRSSKIQFLTSTCRLTALFVTFISSYLFLRLFSNYFHYCNKSNYNNDLNCSFHKLYLNLLAPFFVLLNFFWQRQFFSLTFFANHYVGNISLAFLMLFLNFSEGWDKCVSTK